MTIIYTITSKVLLNVAFLLALIPTPYNLYSARVDLAKSDLYNSKSQIPDLNSVA